MSTTGTKQPLPIAALLEDFYQGEIPGYVVKAGRSFIKIRLSRWDGDDTQLVKITIDDVVEYYRTQAHNISSGMRLLAGTYGDWRQMDYLARECLSWFKHVNVNQLRRRCRKVGLEPRF